MTISSTLAPDLDAVCRALIRRDARAAERIGTGRNSRVYRVSLADAGRDAPSHVVAKFYRRDPGDARDRLATEFGGLQFLWQNGVRAIPRPIAADRHRYCAIYEYIAGGVPDVTAGDIDASVRFLSELRALRTRPDSVNLPVASEACFTLDAIAASVAERLERLRRSAREGDGRTMHAWLDDTFEPLRRETLAWCRAAAARARLAFDDTLSPECRTLSPSDFGFHNAIRRPDGSLAFVDFEYFGWDDPAKTVADFVLHPGMSCPDVLKRRFTERFLAAFADVAGLADRARIVFPMFGLKWCLILLNEFLPERMAAGPAGEPESREAHEIRAAQLAKADAMAERIRREYRDDPPAARS